MTMPRHCGSFLMRPRLPCILMLLVWAGAFGAGCLSTDEPQDRAEAAPGAPRKPLVVAIIDSGVNPYHDAFRVPEGAPDAQTLAAVAGAEVVELSSEGTYDERLADDEVFWRAAKTQRLHAYAGTRLLAVSMSHDPAHVPIIDHWNHGTGVASLIAREAPEAIVVVIQLDVGTCDAMRPTEACDIFSKAAPAMAWAAAQPWIDVISLSIGYPGNVPFHPAYDAGMEPFLRASRLAYESGKVVIAGSGNTLVPPLAAYFAGPPWVVATGGVMPKARGDAPDSSKAVDVVANHTDYVARAGSVDAYSWRSGTSFAAPIVAGVVARTLAEVRAQGEDATPTEVRDALNATAAHFGVTDWDPTKPPTNDTLRNLVTHSAPILAPAAQMGWGYVHGGLVDELVRRVLENDLAVPMEKTATAEHQARWQGVRETYWRNHT